MNCIVVLGIPSQISKTNDYNVINSRMMTLNIS